MKTTGIITGLISFWVIVITPSQAQQITGVWKGKIKSSRVELKLIKKGDTLVGTSYYYDSKTNYRRYAVKGYFDGKTNDVIWWDDALIEDRAHNPAVGPSLVVADFNCPGDGTMKLDGNSSLRDNNSDKNEVNMEKVAVPFFADEWDFVVDNYTVGANDPLVIDSIAMLAFVSSPIPEGYEIAPPPVSIKLTPERSGKTAPVSAPAITIKKESKPAAGIPLSNEEKFRSRKTVLQNAIPITSDSIELRFYDNAEIDGDSIALFMNNKLVFQHLRLSDQAYTIKIASSDLLEDNEMVMVAENLGTIPPNTSLMVVVMGDKRYEARLFADENSSALVRFMKTKH